MTRNRFVFSGLLMIAAWVAAPTLARADFELQVKTPGDTWVIDYSTGTVTKNGIGQTVYQGAGGSWDSGGNFSGTSGAADTNLTGQPWYFQVSGSGTAGDPFKYVQFSLKSVGPGGDHDIKLDTDSGLSSTDGSNVDLEGKLDGFHVTAPVSLTNVNGGTGFTTSAQVKVNNATIINDNASAETLILFASSTGFMFPNSAFETLKTGISYTAINSGDGVNDGNVTAYGIADATNSNTYMTASAFSNQVGPDTTTGVTSDSTTTMGSVTIPFALDLNLQAHVPDGSVDSLGGTVQVDAVVPEPQTWATAFAGIVFISSGWLLRRKLRPQIA